MACGFCNDEALTVVAFGTAQMTPQYVHTCRWPLVHVCACVYFLCPGPRHNFS